MTWQLFDGPSNGNDLSAEVFYGKENFWGKEPLHNLGFHINAVAKESYANLVGTK